MVHALRRRPSDTLKRMAVDVRSLTDIWHIGPVEIPSRIVLAPMAGVSVQAFRRQGRRHGAGLVCSEMVSACGLEHGSKRTQEYLRIAADERPLAVQIFGSEPDAMASAARMCVAAGADIVDINMGCPVRKVTKTGAGATLLGDGADLGARIVAAVAEAIDVPVTVKMRRGVHDDSRDFMVAGPRFVEAGAQALTLHPRSAKQMYTGHADHRLTAELVEAVPVPVIASGDITSRERAHAVLETTGCAAVMIGRGAQGNPWLLESLQADADVQPTDDEVVAELIRFMRETVRELGERRSVHFLRKFYGWYLRRGTFPRSLRQELAQIDALDEVESALLRAAPGAAALVERFEADLAALGTGEDDAELGLPISVYGGG
jgi:tRNA-dihydrouridine synthase B